MIAILVAVVAFGMIAVARWSHLAWRHWACPAHLPLVAAYIIGVGTALGGATLIMLGLVLDGVLTTDALIAVSVVWASFCVVGVVVALGHWLDESREAQALRGDLRAAEDAMRESRGQ